MRQIDADKLANLIKIHKVFSSRSGWSSDMSIDLILGLIEDSPTVEAIPIEQVAIMLAKAYENIPCAVFGRKDEWCNERCKVGCMQWECWLHALKEGWLDDAE